VVPGFVAAGEVLGLGTLSQMVDSKAQCFVRVMAAQQLTQLRAVVCARVPVVLGEVFVEGQFMQVMRCLAECPCMRAAVLPQQACVG
jgi:hypothetical protein